MIGRRRRIEDENEQLYNAPSAYIKFEVGSDNKENIPPPASKRMRYNEKPLAPQAPTLILQPSTKAKNQNFKMSRPQLNRVKRRGQISVLPASDELARARQATEDLIDKYKDMEKVLTFIIDNFGMKDQNVLLTKELLLATLDNNNNLLTTLTQTEVIHTLQMNDFSTGLNGKETFAFSRQKIWKFMEQQQYQLTFQGRSLNKPEKSNFYSKRDADLKVLVKLLLDQNLLNDTNPTVKKQKLRTVFLHNRERMPTLKMSELGSCLAVFGFLETNERIPGIFTFVKRKLYLLQLELMVEKLCKSIEMKFENPDQSTASGLKPSTDSDDEDEVPAEPLYVEHVATLKRTTCLTYFLLANSCLVCRDSFVFASKLELHNIDIHGVTLTIPRTIKERCSIDSRVVKLMLVPSKRTKNLMGQPEKVFALRNLHSMALKVKRILHYYSNVFRPVEPVNRQGLKVVSVGVGETAEIVFNSDFDSLTIGICHSILLFLEDDTNNEYMEHFQIKDSRVFTPKRDPIKPMAMQGFVPSAEIINLFNCGFETTPELTLKETAVMLDVKMLLSKDPKTRLTEENYVRLMTYGIQIADCTDEKQAREFDLKDHVIKQKKPYQIGIELTEDNKIPHDLTDRDSVLMTKEGNKQEMEARIARIYSDFLYLQPKCNPAWYKDAKINIRFIQNRIPIRMESKAMSVVEEQKLSTLLFPKSVPDKIIEITSFEWFNTNIPHNPEQKQAVTMIVNGTAYPNPYIVFGPPGTGKTSTITETICQLWKTAPTSRILVTAQSNAACNEVGERLLKYLPQKDVYRLFARSLEDKIQDIDDKLLKASNLNTRRHEFPEWSEFYGYRVVICTLCTSGTLHSAGIDTQHFTHVFIDECGSSTEPSSLIAIAGIITSPERINGHIILAGDIKQLGPIVKSRIATNLGYAKPLMERLMETPIYSHDPATKRYNPRLITKLLYNFRSHTKIIEYSNKAFYDGELVAKGVPESTNWVLNWCHLPNKNFPIIFHPSYDESCREKANPSMFNVKEIDIVEKYVSVMLTFGINSRSIQQSDIGVISPYKRQCQKMTVRFERNNWKDIEIGTVETFQGREKPIIIISTVRSGGRAVGFLNNPRRLNVSVTRAKALMIIVSNPQTLKNDCHWHDLLKFCQKNGGCVTPIRLGLRPSETRAGVSTLEDMTAEFQQLEEKTKNQKIAAKDFL